MKREHKSVSENFRRRNSRFEARPGHRQRRTPRVFQPRLSNEQVRELLGPEALRTLKELAQEEMNVIRQMEVSKFCGTCHRILVAEENFHKDNHEPDGWCWECKTCVRARRTERHQRIHDLIWRRV